MSNAAAMLGSPSPVNTTRARTVREAGGPILTCGTTDVFASLQRGALTLGLACVGVATALRAMGSSGHAGCSAFARR